VETDRKGERREKGEGREKVREWGGGAASSLFYIESGTHGCCQVTAQQSLEEMLTRDLVPLSHLGEQGTQH
jgi:hypothetical protein